MFQKYTGFMRRPHLIRAAVVLAGAVITIGVSGGSALAHSYPQTTDPQSSARLDSSPAHIGITYDSPIAASGSSMVLLDSTGTAVPSEPDQSDGNRQTSLHPVTDLAPGPYTVDWTSVSADDGHMAQGFYTFVVNGGPVDHLTLNAPTIATSGTPFSLTARAEDAYGNPASGYTGTVSFSSSDPSAFLPTPYQFTTTDSGAKTFGNVILRATGTQTITVSDNAGRVDPSNAITVYSF